MIGTIKKKTDRGFGFIAVPNEEKDLFFHSSALVGVAFDSLSEGATVSFDVETDGSGRQSAKNVQLAEQGEQQSAPVEETAQTEAVEPAETADATEDSPAAAEEPAAVEEAE